MPDDDNGGQGTDPTQAFQNRLAKMNGDAMAFAATLFDENFKQRGRIRELEKLVPADGALVLNKTDAARWKAFNDLGKKPEEIATALTEAETATSEAAKLKRRDTLRDVAEIGFDGSKLKLSVLEKLDGDVEGLEYEIREGKDGKAVFVKHGGKELPLDKFATENESWKDFVPALKADGGQTQTMRGNGQDPAPAGNQSTLERVRAEEQERQKKTAPRARSFAEVWRGRGAQPT